MWAFAHILAGAVVGRDCNVGDHCFIEAGARVGDNVTLKNGVMLWEGVALDDGVFVGPGAIFTNDVRPRSPRHEHGAQRYADARWLVATSVGQGASIGAGAVILAGVTIGPFAMVGAGAVVTRDVAGHALVVGNPARVVGWVCRCGERLEPPGVCPSCGSSYDVSRSAGGEATGGRAEERGSA